MQIQYIICSNRSLVTYLNLASNFVYVSRCIRLLVLKHFFQAFPERVKIYSPYLVFIFLAHNFTFQKMLEDHPIRNIFCRQFLCMFHVRFYLYFASFSFSQTFGKIGKFIVRFLKYFLRLVS